MRKTLPGTENVKCEIVKDKLLIEINLKHRGQTTAKGNTRVCSTLGNKEIPGTKGIMIGLNMYTKN
jgi:hypothetical protein